MLEKKTIVDKIEILRDGTIQIRFALLVVEDGAELSCDWHRTAIPPGGDATVQLSAVNDHLRQMNRATVEDSSLVDSVAQLVHTPEMKKQYAEKMSARN